MSVGNERSTAAAALFLIVAFAGRSVTVEAVSPTHGAVAGDVTHTWATIWSRGDGNSTMQVSVYECDARVVGEEVTGEVEVDSTGDFTGLVDIAGLSAETCYEAEVIFSDSTTASASLSAADDVLASAYATFTTAPLPTVNRAVKFAWGGDISGQNVCRDAAEGFPLMEAMNDVVGLDFFLNVGDAIYGDGVCRAEGLGGNDQVVGNFSRATDLDDYWAHWKYNLEDLGYQTLLSSQAFFMTWDDHEVINDFGPDYDQGSSGKSLLPIGLQAFLNYNPIRATEDPTAPLDFYRTIRWGALVELFVLDTRQYRSLPTDEDTAANPKTMLGETQLVWLKESLTNSTALWKLVVTSVPLSIPTGAGDDARDGWAGFEGATGYEIELEDILRHMSDGDMHDVVFITADVHFAQGLRYQPFPDDPDFDVHEIVVGPLNAGPFTDTDLDDTFAPESLFSYAPERNSLSGFYTYEELRPYFNFGLAEIESNGNLTFSVINTDNETVHSVTIEPREGTLSSDVTVSPASAPPSVAPETVPPSASSSTSSPPLGGSTTSSSPATLSTIAGTPAPSQLADDDPDALSNEDNNSAPIVKRPGLFWAVFALATAVAGISDGSWVLLGVGLP